jgi:hypothetical protein
VTAWSCTACGGPVDLPDALRHSAECVGGDKPVPYRCELCDGPTEADDLCASCLVADISGRAS